MFGQNPVVKQEVGQDPTSLRVVNGKPFYTIQGEGPFAGEPAVFLRLHGCPLRCFFCDTEFSNPADPIVPVKVLVEDIVEAATQVPTPWTDCRLLVITGGEPARQPLDLLILAMLTRGWRVQLETSGILWQDVFSRRVGLTIVTSPKTAKIHPRLFERADAFKYVIQADGVDEADGLPILSTQTEGAESRLQRPRAGAPVFLSPMDEYDPEKNAANRLAVAQLAMRFGYRAGVQLHKVLGDLP